MTILVTLDTIGTDCSVFDLYSNSDGFLSAFETDVPKASLLSGFSSTKAPNETTIVRVKAKGVCTNHIDLALESPASITCDLKFDSILSQNPTNVEGNNGTATITFSGNVGTCKYFLNNIDKGDVTSPIIINNLDANSINEIILIDTQTNCQVSNNFTLGQSSFIFDADFIMITYQFTDGADLDTRTRIITPDVGQNTSANCLGWGVKSRWPTAQEEDPYLIFGDDNTGLGKESVLIDLIKFKDRYPDQDQLVMDLRAFWFNSVGQNPVTIDATLWKGGLPTKDGCEVNTAYYCWKNITNTSEKFVTSANKIITLFNKEPINPGERIATFNYNLVTGEGNFNVNDTSNPLVS